MGYRIEYGGRFADEIIKTTFTKEKKKHYVITALYVFTAFAVLFGVYLRHGSVLPIFLPGDSAVTLTALKDFKECVGGGGSIVEAITAFCRTILENAI